MTKILNGKITELATDEALDTDDAAIVASNGIVAPASTPVYIGQFYVDTAAKKLYVATGISSSADWTIVN